MFSNEFVAGMTTAHRSRILGDLDENAPARWEWGSPSGPRIDIALLLYARDDAGLQRLEAEQTRGLAPGGLALRHRLGTSDLDDFEPFGFRDGISQPFVEGLSKTGPPETTVRAGEFLLGYPNEYDLYTGRPLLDPAADPDATLPRDPEGSGRADLGRNGSYLVLRQLRQDVPGFWRFLDGVTPTPRRHERPGGAASRRLEDGRSLAERRAAHARARRRRPEPRRPPTTSATTSSTRAELAARSARTSVAPTRATPSIPGRGAATRGRSTAATASCVEAASTGRR